MIVRLIEEAVANGARRAAACAELGLDARTLERWRAGKAYDDGRRGPLQAPKNKLTAAERARIIEVATNEEFRDLSPKQIVPRLADKGEYVGSESTVYRILRTEKLMTHRGRAKPRTSRPKVEHFAEGPNEVWSWDITYLRASVCGSFYYLYLMVDVWSRKIVGFSVEDVESTELASDLLCQAVQCGVPRVLHADNGGPMKGATLKATMEMLGILASYSRPSVSDDNPFSESLFRTMKYRPEYPKGAFASLDDARAWVASFVGWYNEVHLHSGIGFMTPSDRHAGRGEAVLSARRGVYRIAHEQNPERWSGAIRPWTAPSTVRLNPINHAHGRVSEKAEAA